MPVTVILAVVLFAHGIGHLLFLGPALKVVDWAGQTGHSWLLSAPLGETVSRGLAATLWTGSIVLLVAGAGALLAGQAWWRPACALGAVVSLVGIVLFWDGVAATNAFFALAFDVLVLGALLVAHWPTTELVGS